MKKLAMSLWSCNDAHKLLPPAYEAFAGVRSPASVHVHLLKFIEEDALYRSFVQEENGISAAAVAGFQSPRDPTLGSGAGVQNYAANLRVFSDIGIASYTFGSPPRYIPVPLSSIMPGHARIPRTFLDGTSNTVCFATKLATCTQQSSTSDAGGIEGGSHYAAHPISPFAAFFGENAPKLRGHPSDPDAAFQLAPQAFECRVWPLMAQSFSLRGVTVALGDGSVRTVGPEISPETWMLALQPNDGCGYGGCDW